MAIILTRKRVIDSRNTFDQIERSFNPSDVIACFESTVNPDNTFDINNGYQVGFVIVNTTLDIYWICLDDLADNAIWGRIILESDIDIWKTINSDSGSTDADSLSDTLTISGGTGISTAISGDNLTITNTGGGATIADYLWVYDTTTQGIVLINTYQDVTFATNGVINGWTHTEGNAELTCPTTGVYSIQFHGHFFKSAGGGQSQAAIRLVKNGTEIAGSHVGFDIQGNNISLSATNSIIVNLTSADVLKYQIAGDSVNISLAPGPDPASASTDVGATMTITRIA